MLCNMITGHDFARDLSSYSRISIRAEEVQWLSTIVILMLNEPLLSSILYFVYVYYYVCPIVYITYYT